MHTQGLFQGTPGGAFAPLGFWNLEFGIVTCARLEVTLLSEELLYTRIASSTLSFLRLLYTPVFLYTTYCTCNNFMYREVLLTATN